MHSCQVRTSDNCRSAGGVRRVVALKFRMNAHSLLLRTHLGVADYPVRFEKFERR